MKARTEAEVLLSEAHCEGLGASEGLAVSIAC